MNILRPVSRRAARTVTGLLAVALIGILLPAPSGAAAKHAAAPKSHRHHRVTQNKGAKARRPLSNLGYGSNSTANPTGAATTGAK